MKTILCNESNPSITKIALLTDNKITGIYKSQGIYYCKLNGKVTKVSNARKEMLKDVILVNHSGSPCTFGQ